MRRTFWVVVALLIASSVGVGAKEKRLGGGGAIPDSPLVAEKIDPKVAQLIADLGSDDYRAREKAGNDLAALGEKALPGMRAALLATESPEVQRRLSVLVRKMDNERLVSPKKVTMALKDKTVKDALDEITKQTGYKIDFSGNTDTKQDFNFDNTPFWVDVEAAADLGDHRVAGHEADAAVAGVDGVLAGQGVGKGDGGHGGFLLSVRCFADVSTT
jgi:hypothetical protein